VDWAGPDSWAELSPKKEGPLSTQNSWAELDPPDSSSFNFSDGLDPAQPTGLGQDRSSPKQLSHWHNPVTKLHAIVQRELIHVALFTCSYNREGRKKKKRGGKLTWH
jgi:hypothetical protein